MKKGRLTWGQLDVEIEALIARKKQLVEKAAETFIKALMRNDVKDLLADLSDAELRQVARYVADMLPWAVDNVKQKMPETDTAKKQNEARDTDSARSDAENKSSDGNINA